jgi:hypothetical protein
VNHHYVIAEQFFDQPDALRAAFESHFSNPMSHSGPQQVWNYWYVPGAYTYLKTDPLKIMPRPLIDRFMQYLNQWAINTLGLSTQLNPWLSLYVNGCGQTLHNDAAAGQMGFVYSLTKWDQRNFLGGETILFHPNNYWQTERIKSSGAGTSFYDLVPSKYNQLVIFDDRVIHGVQTLQGTMDPLCGRVVLHGHLKAEAVALSGALAGDAAIPAIRPAMERLATLTREAVASVNGFITLRLMIASDGRVTLIQPLCDRLLALTPDTQPVERFRQNLVQNFSDVRFPAADGDSQLTLPVVVVG